MLQQIAPDCYGFLWDSPRENNCNTYLIAQDTKILIDPGHLHLFGHVEQGLDRLGLTVQDLDVVLISHGHPDHLEAASRFQDLALVGMSARDHAFVQHMAGQLAEVPQPDFLLQAGSLRLGKVELEVLETPGHSPGGVCFYWPARKALFTGDLIFAQGYGRTDLPGGDHGQLEQSIAKVQALAPELLLSGHGDIVAGREQVQEAFSLTHRMLGMV